MIQQLNKVELIGHVGLVSRKTIEGKTCAQISLATNYCYRAKDGTAIIETTWHKIVAFEGRDNRDLDEVEKGDALHVVGRIRTVRYTDQDGNNKNVTEILASKTEIIKDEGYQPENTDKI